MHDISGENWKGRVDKHIPIQARGVVDGYPWYFVARDDRWSMEICNDQELSCERLPLVGYGVGGWLIDADYNQNNQFACTDKSTALQLIEEVIGRFRENKLVFTPPYPSNCS